jgi:DNA polymerase elongation subunit (family B)
VPEALNVVKEYGQKLLNGEIPVCDLVVTKHLSKDPRKYKQRVSQVIAAEQLMKEGAEVHAGKNVRFLFTSAQNKRYERRVRAEELVERETNPDVKKYLFLLYTAAANILSPLGYTTKQVYDAVRGYHHTKLESF